MALVCYFNLNWLVAICWTVAQRIETSNFLKIGNPKLCKTLGRNSKCFCNRGALRVSPVFPKKNSQNVLPGFRISTRFLIAIKVSSARCWPFVHVKSQRMWCLINKMIMHRVFHWVKCNWGSTQYWNNCFLQPQRHKASILLNGRWNNRSNVSENWNVIDHHRVGRQLNDCKSFNLLICSNKGGGFLFGMMNRSSINWVRVVNVTVKDASEQWDNAM